MSIQPEEIPNAVAEMRQSFKQGKTKSYEWRIKQLNQLLLLLKEGRDELCEGMKKDLNKSYFESYMTELNMVEMETTEAIHKLKGWMKPEWKTSNLFNTPTTYSEVNNDPLGVVLIMGAWNYNVVLTLTPLVGAICGGNCAMLKPGSYSAFAGAAMGRLVDKYMDSDCIKIVEGNRDVNAALLKEKWDLIFCTGSGLIGRLVAAAAAPNLTPCVLELGGKSPCIITPSCDLTVTARRMLHGALLNAGQTCVRPDTMFVHESIADEFIKTIKSTLLDFYGANPQKTEFYGRIINDKSFKRVANLIKSSSKYIVHGGEMDGADKFIAPTVFDFKDDWEAFEASEIMQDEVFGPLIPIIRYNDLQKQVIPFIQDRDKPLALYLFSSNTTEHEIVKKDTTSGGLVINDVCVHLSNSSLPFGGVGESGMGAYHGRYSFETFTHQKATMVRPIGQIFDLPANLMRYPPYTQFKQTSLGIMQMPIFSGIWETVMSNLEPKNAIIAGLSAALVVQGYRHSRL